MIDKIRNRFTSEITVIRGYVDYIENNFYNSSRKILKTQGYERLKILEGYAFFQKILNKRKKIGKY